MGLCYEVLGNKTMADQAYLEAWNALNDERTGRKRNSKHDTLLLGAHADRGKEGASNTREDTAVSSGVVEDLNVVGRCVKR